MKFRQSVFLLVALVLSAAASAADLRTAEIKAVEAPRIYRLDGLVEAVNKTTLTAQTSGQVQEVLVDVDDYVHQGQVVVVLKSKEQQARVAQAQANLRGAKARLAAASAEFKRVEGVFAKKLVSKSDMDKARSALKSARAAKQAAAAALVQAEQGLAYTRVKAPYTGIVTERHIQVGETAQPGKPLVSGISLEKLRIVVDVPQNVIEAVRGLAEAFVQQPGKGWVRADRLTVFPYAESGSNTFKVRLYLDKSKGLLPGMYVKTAFTVGRRRALVVPSRAVVYRSEVVAVYVLDTKGMVSMRHVRVGHDIGQGQLQVLSGLSAGERVALDPVEAAVVLKQQRSAGA